MIERLSELARIHAESRRLVGRTRHHIDILPPGEAAALARSLDQLLVRSLAIAGQLDDLAGKVGPAGVDDRWDVFQRAMEVQLRDELSNVCFGAGLELRQMRRQIEAAGDRDVELLVAVESSSRKLRRVIVAILEAAERVSDDPVPRIAAPTEELEAGLAVRRLYARFGRALRPYDPGDQSSIMNALRYAAGALAAMVASADFSETRLPDRRMLLDLQARLLAWARGDRDIAEGERILSDIGTTSALLRGINGRQELRAHDAALVASLLAERPRDVAQVRRFLARVRELEGRDDELDARTAEALVASPTPESLTGLREALERLGRAG